MKVSEDVKNDIITATLINLDAVVDVAKEHIADNEKDSIKEGVSHLLELTAQLETARKLGDRHEEAILKELLEDFRVVELARYEVLAIQRDQKAREKLFRLLQGAALDAARIAVKAAILL